MSVVEALGREIGSVGKALRELDPEDWAKPTRCPPMTVKDLVAHTAGGAGRVEEMLDAGPLDSEPEKDAVTYFQYDPVAEAPGILARALDRSAAIADGAAMVKHWDTAWSRALRRAREALADDPVLRGPFGSLCLSEYLRTRCVEVVVHHMDLDDAIGRPPHPDAGALEVVGDVLRGLLGTDLRPQGTDDVRFALVGTGRAPLDDREREYLGPLVQKFPLLA